MREYVKKFAPVMLGCSLIAGAGCLDAQISDTIRAHLNHSFLIGDKTLPPGDYTLRMSHDPADGVMIIQNKSGDNVAEFTVRQSVDSRTPKHTELMFRKYGNAEFLSKVYEGAQKTASLSPKTAKKKRNCWRAANAARNMPRNNRRVGTVSLPRVKIIERTHSPDIAAIFGAVRAHILHASGH